MILAGHLLKNQANSLRILYLQYANPAVYPPLEHSSRILAQAGWEVTFLGIGALGADALRFPPGERIQVKQLPFVAAGWRQKLHYLRFTLLSLWWTLRWRPDWIYASDLLSGPAGWLLSCVLRRRVVYHEHDAPATKGENFFQRLCLVARRALARRAQLCIVPNQQRLEKFSAETGVAENLLCVWNCPRQEEVVAPRAPRPSDLWVLYHGSIVPDRLPVSVLEALALLPETVKLRVVGYETIGSLGYVGQLKELAARLGISKRIEFLGAVPQRSDLLSICRRCDVGLAFMPLGSNDLNMQAMTGASNKPFDYLACGLALLVSDLPDWREMYVAHGYGRVCDPSNPQSIAAALRWYLEHPVEMRAMGENGRQRIAREWNYETQFSLVQRQISGIF